jgi:hypothetical protein
VGELGEDDLEEDFDEEHDDRDAVGAHPREDVNLVGELPGVDLVEELQEHENCVEECEVPTRTQLLRDMRTRIYSLDICGVEVGTAFGAVVVEAPSRANVAIRPTVIELPIALQRTSRPLDLMT